MPYFLFILILAVSSALRAEEVEGQEVTWISLPVRTVLIEEKEESHLPPADYQQVRSSTSVATKVRQPVSFEYSLFEDIPLYFRFRSEARLESRQDPVLRMNLNNVFAIAQQPSLVADFSPSSSAALTLESVRYLTPESDVQWASRVEATTKSRFSEKVEFGTAVGVNQLSDAAGQVIEQRYVTLKMEQRIFDTPMRLQLSPGLTEEAQNFGDRLTRILAQVGAAVLYDAGQNTTLTLGAAYTANTGFSDDLAARYRSVYSQIEQRLSPGMAVQVRANYEDNSVLEMRHLSAMALVLESSFTISPTIKSGLLLQQRMAEMMESSEVLSETILSLSVNGSF